MSAPPRSRPVPVLPAIKAAGGAKASPPARLSPKARARIAEVFARFGILLEQEPVELGPNPEPPA